MLNSKSNLFLIAILYALILTAEFLKSRIQNQITPLTKHEWQNVKMKQYLLINR